MLPPSGVTHCHYGATTGGALYRHLKGSAGTLLPTSVSSPTFSWTTLRLQAVGSNGRGLIYLHTPYR